MLSLVDVEKEVVKKEATEARKKAEADTTARLKASGHLEALSKSVGRASDNGKSGIREVKMPLLKNGHLTSTLRLLSRKIQFQEALLKCLPAPACSGCVGPGSCSYCRIPGCGRWTEATAEIFGPTQEQEKTTQE